jgi:PAS domain S-box-containing protein
MSSTTLDSRQSALVDVLLVEDNPMDARLVTAAFAGWELSGHRLQHACSLTEALQLIRDHSFAAILLDLNLGDSQGYETFRSVQAAAPSAAIVVLSVCDDDDLAMSTVRDGAQDYLHKGTYNGPALLRSLRYAVERKRAEEELRHSQATVRAVFESSLDGMVICDDEGQCLETNAAARELMVLPGESLVGRNLAEFAGEGCQPKWKQFLLDGSMRTETWLRRTDGERHLVDCSFKASILPGKHLGILRDITEQHSLEEQVRQAQKMDAVGRLAGGVAHDFNNILGVIRGYAELLQASLQNASQNARVDKILSATERAALLTQQLMAFGRQQPFAPELLDLSELLPGLQAMLTCLLGPESRVDIRIGKDLGLVKADRVQLEQVILSIASNARDAMPGGGMLAIAAENCDHLDAQPELAPGEYVRMSFSDTGSGMDQETQLRIFEPFFTTKPSASGLGLSTVYGIVQQSGGQVTVQSALMQGTTISVFLPVARKITAQEVHTDNANPPSRPRPGSETILLVDDEPDLRNAAAEYLECHGYKVLTAGSGTEAIEIADRFPGKISLLISDIMMPKLSGPALVDYILKKRPDTPVMVISGYAADEMRNHQSLMKPASFLQKPFTLSMLAGKIRNLLDEKRGS